MHPWNDAFKRHGTDKYLHNYGYVYELLFGHRRRESLNILEIGVHKGASIRAWRELFPYAFVYGIDKDSEQIRQLSLDGLGGLYCIDASNVQELDNFMHGRPPLDIVIDDGSHQPNDVRIAFDYFWPRLNTNGIYVIEDLDVAWYPEYQQPPTIIDQELARLKADTHSTGVKDRITVVAGELIAFVKIRNEH